jgi:hypothetical protein
VRNSLSWQVGVLNFLSVLVFSMSLNFTAAHAQKLPSPTIDNLHKKDRHTPKGYACLKSNI